MQDPLENPVGPQGTKGDVEPFGSHRQIPFEIGEIFNGCECHSTSVTGRIARRPMLPVHCRWMFRVGCIRQIDKLQAPSFARFLSKT